MESDCRVLEPLRESSAPGALLVLVRSQIRLGSKARHSIHRSTLSVNRHIIVSMLNFLRFKSNLESSRRIIRLEHRVHSNLSHFLVLEAHRKRMLHLCARKLNVDGL
jgi:hypothetical protein